MRNVAPCDFPPKNLYFPLPQESMRTTFHYPESPYGRTYADVITKISRTDSLPNYLSYGATLARASRAQGVPLKTLPTKMKPTKCSASEKKKWGKKSEKRGEERKRKVKVKTAVSKFCFLRMPELRKLIFCIWIRRPRSVRPVNRCVVSFSSL